MALITDFLVGLHLAALKSFSQLKFTTLYAGQVRHRSYFFYILLDRACSEVAAFLQTAGAHHISNVF